MIKAVLDTNVLISAIMSSKGAPALILKLIYERQIELFISPKIAQEFWQVIHYPKIVKFLTKKEIPVSSAENIVKNLNEISTITAGKLAVDMVKNDPSDNVFLSCALEGKVDFIISGDKHLLQLEQCEGIPILKPQDFLNRL